MSIHTEQMARPTYPPGEPSPIAACIEPLALTNTLIARFGGRGGIQHMKLQKLSYYAHAWWLSHYETPFLCERPQVWRYGPVFADMYHSLKGFGSDPITGLQATRPFEEPPTIENSPELSGLIDWVWARYGGMSAGMLSDRTHAPGTPWRILAERYKYSVPAHLIIDDDTIKACFRRDTEEVLRTQ
jgi:uncharacterized phage-associated protein